MFKSSFAKHISAFVLIIFASFIILSGIIAPRADEVREKVAECGFKVVREEQENDWVALMVRKEV